LKDEEAIDWCKRISSFHWTRGTNSRKIMEAYQKKKKKHCVYEKREKEEENEV
jgi:hypothetical protein